MPHSQHSINLIWHALQQRRAKPSRERFQSYSTPGAKMKPCCICQFAGFTLFWRKDVLKGWKFFSATWTKFTYGWVGAVAFVASFHGTNARQPFVRLANDEEVFSPVVTSPQQSVKRTKNVCKTSVCRHTCVPTPIPTFIREVRVLLAHNALTLRFGSDIIFRLLLNYDILMLEFCDIIYQASTLVLDGGSIICLLFVQIFKTSLITTNRPSNSNCTGCFNIEHCFLC